MSIKRSNLDGSNVETVISGLTGEAFGLALDVASETIYWVGVSDNKVRKANYDGTNQQVIHTASSGLIDIALDLTRGRLHVTEYNSDRILRMNLDGSGVVSLPVPEHPAGIAIDTTNERLYVASFATSAIIISDLDGQITASVATMASGPYGIDFDPIAQKIYWIRSSGGIYRLNTDGSGQELVSSAATKRSRSLKLDIDRDEDGVRNSLDECPIDPNKSVAGSCGCGNLETDSDGDGTPDCIDSCPSDASKTSPGVCGCGVSDIDSDGDQTPNCIDSCAQHAIKTSVGICGCSIQDADENNNGITDCLPEEMVDLKAKALRRRLNSFTSKSSARLTKRLSRALKQLRTATADFPSSGTDVSKTQLLVSTRSTSRAVNTLLKLQARRGPNRKFRRVKTKAQRSVAAIIELLATAR